MSIAKWKNLDIKKVNKQRALILCKQRVNGEKLAQFFRGKGMLAICFTSHKDFYMALSRSEGSFALVSNQYDADLLKVMPDFIVAKFGCPVVVFSEVLTGKRKSFAGMPNKDEVISVKGGFQQIHHTMKNYENIVSKQKAVSVTEAEEVGLFSLALPEQDEEDISDEIFDEGDHSFVPIEYWWVQNPMPCKAYLSLEKNEKKILFIHEGERLRSEAFDRFMGKYYSHLAIEKKDKVKFLEYRKLLSLQDAA